MGMSSRPVLLGILGLMFGILGLTVGVYDANNRVDGIQSPGLEGAAIFWIFGLVFVILGMVNDYEERKRK